MVRTDAQVGEGTLHRTVTAIFYRWMYRPLMRLAHRFHWHYAPPMYPEGDTVLWCKWCGFRQKVKSNPPRIFDAIEPLCPGVEKQLLSK